MPKKKNTRNASGSGSIRQRKDGTWEGRYSAGTNPGTGKPIRKSVYASSQREANDKLIAIQAGIASGTFVEPSKLTVSQWLDIWVAEYLGGVKPNTVSSYKSTCNNHLKPNLGAVKLSALSAHMVQTLYNRLEKGTNDKKGLSPKTIKNINGVLHKALQQAVKLGYIVNNAADAVELPRVEKHEIQPLEADKIAELLEAMASHKFDCIYLVTLFCGLRQGEALGLHWDSVDFKQGTILINKQLQKNREIGKYEIVTTKNSKGRRITPALSVMAALWEHRRKQFEWRFRL